MTFKKITTVLAMFSFIASTAFGQHFMPPVSSFSKKKTSYIHLENGKTVKGNIKDFDWKKGLIEEIKILDANGKKVKIKPEEIKHMYLPPSGWSKFASSLDFLHDATKWDNTDLEQDIISKGYVYMEKSDVRIKKKTRTLMVQLLNPSFSSKIKAYFDPITGETASLGVAGVKVAGGDAKTYFVKKSDEKTAFELKKKNYKEEFKMLFGDCKELMKKYGDNPKWSQVETHIYEYTQLCK